MVCKISRRLLLERSALVGSGATLYSLTLIGCGGASPGGGQSPAANLPAPAPTPSPTPSATPGATPVPTTTLWRSLRVGAGGFLTGIDIANDGTKVVRTDTHGAYIWNTATNEWSQMMTKASMPSGEWGHEYIDHHAVFEICIFPSDSNRMYLVSNGLVYKTINRGATWTKTNLSKLTADANDDHRVKGRKMAIDPANPDVVIVGGQDTGAFITTNGGANWTKIAGIPAPTSAIGIAVAYDPSSGVANGKTKTVYVSSAGNGIYRSTDGGATFSLMAGSPTVHHRMIVDQGGTVWVTMKGADVAILRSGSSTWSTVVPAAGAFTQIIAVNPANVKHVVSALDSGWISQSFDAGATWTGTYYPEYPMGAGRRVATDIPWLAWTNESYMTGGEMRFDPSATNKLYFSQGIGVWWTNPPQTYVAYDWTSQSKGIEQLVSSRMISAPGAAPVYFCWDRGVFKIDNPDVYPSTHGPNRKHSLISGWSGDYAVDDPNFVVGLLNWWGRDESGYSTDGGTTWTKFTAIPDDVTAGKMGGSIAVSTRDNMIWVPSNNGSPYVTKDRGATWTKIVLPNVPTTGETGWGWAYYLNRQIVTADKVTPGTFYLYNYKTGVYRSTDGGTNWTLVFRGELAGFSGFNASLTSVPGKAGHLFFTVGWQTGANPYQSPLKRSTDGGATWQDVANSLEAYAFGFGKAAPNSDYPAIFYAGYYKNEWGIFRSDNNAASFVKIGDYPGGNADNIKTISGDMNIYGRCFVGFHGSGGAVADLG